MTGLYLIASQMASPDLICRPLCDLLRKLPLLPLTETGIPDYVSANPDLLVGLAESAELVLRIVHDGFSAIGLLHTCTAQQIASGDISAAHTAALGRLLVELGEALVYVQALSFECRRYTADYVSDAKAAGDR